MTIISDCVELSLIFWGITRVWFDGDFNQLTITVYMEKTTLRHIPIITACEGWRPWSVRRRTSEVGSVTTVKISTNVKKKKVHRIWRKYNKDVYTQRRDNETVKSTTGELLTPHYNFMNQNGKNRSLSKKYVLLGASRNSIQRLLVYPTSQETQGVLRSASPDSCPRNSRIEWR
jgi:hypothetical protein